MNAHFMPDQVNLRSVHLGRVRDEFGELQGAIRILALLAHEFPCEAEMHDLIGWQVSRVEELAAAFISRVEAHS
jgi:hypothetical protein